MLARERRPQASGHLVQLLAVRMAAMNEPEIDSHPVPAPSGQHVEVYVQDLLSCLATVGEKEIDATETRIDAA